MNDLVVIDGSYGEGGGQVLRTSLALAAITGRPLEIHSIRGKRAKPGLQPQHLMAAKAAAEICGAELKGAEVQSGYLRFAPARKVEAGDFRFDIGTAGATTLVLQTVFVPLALAGGVSRVTVTGGTHNPSAPPADYLEHVFLPAMRRMGVESTLNVPRFGFFPKGGGEVSLELSGSGGLQPILLEERGKLVAEIGWIDLASLPEEVGRRGAERLRSFVDERVSIEVRERMALSPGAAAFVAAQYENGFAGYTGIGARGKRMEVVSEEAGQPYAEWKQGSSTVDEHLADQLVLPAALASGRSRWRTNSVTEHLTTVAWVVSQFLDREIEIDEETGWVTVHGDPVR
ncbi:RNA 3'-terminal phosphate cyclase [Fimbriimonas ginsengisoli]|uniref:RNA 3'-terminal phosphate cyclase n=1 Tax=Fimbriimonas ginsengisoli Gsoil 348 TaxID=661478 RepID=A0A068NVR1_FIMGI|nr:RNA 3'-terminal phosphate cyclase [Fimbriimonas ginsengisoli]AIE87457.1 RNA 3'-terminal-phosphate cyclase [Fimbriimonas ginsengisoli Gsoil 348]